MFASGICSTFPHSPVVNKQRRFFFLDVETTGLSYYIHPPATASRVIGDRVIR